MWTKIFKHQLWHILLLIALLFALYIYSEKDTSVLKGDLWGISTFNWFILTILSPIIHQFYVLICWRIELHYKSISKRFGKNGFKIFKIGFTFLILSRPVTIILLAISNSMTIYITSAFSYVLSVILFIPLMYLFFSVAKYFGINRAFGLDHFYPEMYKNTPFIKQGIYKYTSNAMYIFGILLLWIPGILLQSKAALLIALYNHLYVWIHYYFTELPDIKIIYSEHKK